jgi:AcrR family transcriptional regulator
MRPAGRPHESAVNRERLVAEGIRLLDEEGYASFSIRRLADRVGVTPATVRHHLGGRTEVLIAVVDGMLREMPWLDLELADDWRDGVRLLAAGFREVLHRHPRATMLIVDVAPRSPAGLELSIRLVVELRRGGIPVSRLLDVHTALLAYATGFCVQEQVEGLTGVTHPGLLAQLDRLPPSEFKESFLELLPALDAAAKQASPIGSRFVEGLDALLAGLSAVAVDAELER